MVMKKVMKKDGQELLDIQAHTHSGVATVGPGRA